MLTTQCTIMLSLSHLCPQAREYCTLGHVLSLWETLSVQLAQQLMFQRQVPIELSSVIMVSVATLDISKLREPCQSGHITLDISKLREPCQSGHILGVLVSLLEGFHYTLAVHNVSYVLCMV